MSTSEKSGIVKVFVAGSEGNVLLEGETCGEAMDASRVLKALQYVGRVDPISLQRMSS